MIDRVQGQKIAVHIPVPPTRVEPTSRYVYHWDRIFGALAALALVIGVIGYGLHAWLRPSVPSASVGFEEVSGQETKQADAAQQSEGARLRVAGEPAAGNQPSSGAAEVSPAEPSEPEPVLAPLSADVTPRPLAESPVRERIAEPAAPVPVPESSAQKPRPAVGPPLAESDSQSHNNVATDRPEEVEQMPLSETETEPSAAVAVAETSEGPSGDGRLRSRNTSISSPAVKRFVLARSMRGNEPGGNLDDITLSGGRDVTIHSFSEVIGLEGEVLEYRWLHEGKRVLRIHVPVGAERWRSHSTKRIYPKMTGAWRVELHDSAGKLLASIDFVF